MTQTSIEVLLPVVRAQYHPGSSSLPNHYEFFLLVAYEYQPERDVTTSDLVDAAFEHIRKDARILDSRVLVSLYQVRPVYLCTTHWLIMT